LKQSVCSSVEDVHKKDLPCEISAELRSANVDEGFASLKGKGGSARRTPALGILIAGIVGVIY
jgi:hypothetical protein